MNNTRRKQLNAIKDRLDELMADLEMLRDEEAEYLENIPENLQGSERYERAEEALDYLETALNNICDASESIEVATA